MVTSKKDDLILCAVVTKNYASIFEHLFLPTVPPSFKEIIVLQVIEPEDKLAIPGNVATPNFKKINFLKLCFLQDLIKLNMGKKLLILDVDIVCTADFKDYISVKLDECDLVFQQQNDPEANGRVNVGVFGINCSEKVLTFFEMEVEPRARALLREISHDTMVDMSSMLRPEIDFVKVNNLLKKKGYGGIEEYLQSRPLESGLFQEMISACDPKNAGEIIPSGDQCIINNSLFYSFEVHSNITFNLLPKTFFQGGLATKQPFTSPYNLPDSCALFHAIGFNNDDAEAEQQADAAYRRPEVPNKVSVLSEAWRNYIHEHYQDSLAFLSVFGGPKRVGVVSCNVEILDSLNTAEEFENFKRPIVLENMEDIRYYPRE